MAINVMQEIPGQREHQWETLMILGLAMVTGVVGGLGAILFRLMIGWAHSFLVGDVGMTMARTNTMLIALVPAIGLVLVNLISHYLAREVKGHGVPQILESLALRGGKIRPRVGFFGIIAPAITIGSGGSVGREGPIALIGASFGSSLGQLLKLSDKYTSLLLACGSAAGIGATFNAPIAGGFFGLEIILGTYAMGAMVPVFLASVTGVTVFDSIMGGGAILATPPYHVINHFALLFMMGLGVLTALVGFLYTRGLTVSEDLFDRMKIPFWVKGILGGLFVGIAGLFMPQVLGVGYPTMHLALDGRIFLGSLALLFVGKYLATIVTIGAGGSGGVFAPALFIGGMFGGLFGAILHQISANLAPHPAIYAVAGMAALFAASAQAPFVAITILLEITGDYHLTAPVMACASVSYLVYSFLTRDSMYTVKLTRRGIRILRGNDVRPTEEVSVMAAVESFEGRQVAGDVSVREVYQTLMMNPNESWLVVLDKSKQAIGWVTLDILLHSDNQMDDETPVMRVASRWPAVVRQNRSLDDALRLFGLYDVEILPVRGDRGIVGLVTEKSVIRVYHASTLTTIDTAQQIRALSASEGDPGTFIEVPVGETSWMVHQAVKNLALPPQALVVSIKKKGQLVVPHGNTVIEADDRITVFVAPSAAADSVRRQLSKSVDE
ncbi:MAG: chloride channel protein [Sulfobacillus sp.]